MAPKALGHAHALLDSSWTRMGSVAFAPLAITDPCAWHALRTPMEPATGVERVTTASPGPGGANAPGGTEDLRARATARLSTMAHCAIKARAPRQDAAATRTLR